MLRAATAGAAAAAAIAAGRRAGAAPEPPRGPDVVLVILDDMRDSDWRALPETTRLLAARGSLFPHYLCATPLCGPARASLLTGRRAGRSPIRTNEDGPAGLSGPNIPEALLARGYQTALFGKYLNGAGNAAPPGWSAFDSKTSGNVPRIQRKALSWLGRISADPFFLCLAPNAPHDPPRPPARYLDLYPDEPDPDRWRLQMCRGVDDLIAAVARRLRALRRLDGTLFIVLSDNGFHSRGEHGILDKGTPYAESLRVSMRAMGPGIPAGGVSGRLVCPQDIPVTIARLAGARIAGADGDDFRSSSRQYRLIEFFAGSPLGPWRGLASQTWTYVEWSDGRRSFLDRTRDPSETTDFYPSLPPEQRALLASYLQAELAR
ncbi:MAG: sulfatase-like hydrolase/transferase [Chloroflexota bacterium]